MMIMAEGKPVAGYIFAHPKLVIYLHWFNAICWFLLTTTGLGIISGDNVRIVPAFWPELMQNLMGGNANLILLHSIVAMVWGGIFIFCALLYWRTATWPFLLQILPVNGFLERDKNHNIFQYLFNGTITSIKRIIQDLNFMTVTIARLFGMMKKVELPPIGRYNGAQRMLGTMIIACSIVILITGLMMFFYSFLGVTPIIFRWSLLLHAFCVGFVWIGLIAHIYIALVEEPEFLEAMKSGYLEEEFVKQHKPAWYKELQEKGD